MTTSHPSSEEKVTSSDLQEYGKSQSVKLVIQGIGPVPPLKNSKAIWRKKDGTPFIATKPETKEWMRKAIQSLQSQLKSFARTTGGVMPMDAYLPCLIALLEHSMDFDDSVQWIPEMTVKFVPCEKVQDGAIISITKL